MARISGNGIEILEVGPAVAGVYPSVELPGCVLTPGLVNAHCHLDLTHIGPLPLSERGFSGFVDEVRARRHTDPPAIHASVEAGVSLSRSGGVVAVGDICGAVRGGADLEAFSALARSGMLGVGFLEFFAMGDSTDRALGRLEAAWAGATGNGRMSVGLQPHAPYSVCRKGYRRAAALAGARGAILATHVAESPAEHEFVGSAAGPQRALLETLGLWNDGLLGEFGLHKTPLEQIADLFDEGQKVLLVHLNDISDEDLKRLERLNERVELSVAYCPRASDYFRTAESFGPHRYREMTKAGINVCLGTDSIINLPEAEVCGEAGRICPADDAAHLARRDGADPLGLLAMMTSCGARALGLRSDEFEFRPGATLAGICVVRPHGPAIADERGVDLWARALLKGFEIALVDRGGRVRNGAVLA
ncbi:MAG: amidohydrolase family protein [Phycisphaerales bacterium]